MTWPRAAELTSVFDLHLFNDEYTEKVFAAWTLAAEEMIQGLFY